MSRGVSVISVAFGLWVALFPLLLAMSLWPVNARSLRLGILITVGGLILGSLVFARKRRAVFFSLIATYSAIGLFFLMPGHPPKNLPELQGLYVEAMTAYEGVPYVWGGENRFGMDCSGLVRKGFENALLKEGILTMNPFLIRGAFDLWWNDTTASKIGGGYDGRTIHITPCSSLNDLDSALLLPGDMAVTTSGTHVMAYLGNNKWIGADPGEMKVTIFTTPEPKNGWFACPMNIVRWSKINGE